MKRWERFVEGGQSNLFGEGTHRILPTVPDTKWRAKPFPDLRREKLVAIDIETCDPKLRDKGPGFRRDAYIVGIAAGTADEQWYFPMMHQDRTHCLDPDTVLRWARDNLCVEGQGKVGANLMYDLDGLWTAGVPVTGPYYDIQYAEPLIDEHARSYSLQSIAEKYLGEGKEANLLYEWSMKAYGGSLTEQGKNIWRCPAALVGPYAEADARLPFEVLQKQMDVLEREELDDLFRLECRLIPMLLAMRLRGVKVDTERAEAEAVRLETRAQKLRERLLAHKIDPLSASTIQAYCDEKRIRYSQTAKGNASFTSPWLAIQKDPVLQGVHEVRKLEKHAGTFLRGAILGNAARGRVHCQFNPLRSDAGGTVSGRFSSTDPNLQNIPARDEDLGPLLRSLFIADEGESWFSDDWDSIEFRLLVHYAMGRGADRAREAFALDPNTDFHSMVSEITGIPRKPTKNINFGLVYGMGQKTMAYNMGKTIEEVQPMFDVYHEKFPFVKQTYDNLASRASSRGYIITHLKRRRRFDLWEPRDWELSREVDPVSKEAAVKLWGEYGTRRAKTHKALNALLQGSAADIMKKAMVDIWESGICDVMGAPLLTVHDELNWSAPKEKPQIEAHNEAVRIMENCVSLRVPLRVSSNAGANWDEAK